MFTSPKHLLRRRLIQAAAATCCTLGLAGAALAQAPAWPAKPIRLVVGIAGAVGRVSGAIDALARQSGSVGRTSSGNGFCQCTARAQSVDRGD